MNVYGSIIAGLKEAIEDVRSDQKTLKRNTLESDTGCAIFPLEITFQSTKDTWFNSGENVSFISVERKSQQKETERSVILTCAA